MEQNSTQRAITKMTNNYGQVKWQLTLLETMYQDLQIKHKELEKKYDKAINDLRELQETIEKTGKG